MILRPAILMLVWMQTGARAVALSNEDGEVRVDSPACNMKDYLLHCDYKEYTEQMVYLQQPLPKQTQRLVVQNAMKLSLYEICVNITLDNIADVVIKQGFEIDCNYDLELIIRNSVVDQLPSHASVLTLENSLLNTLTSSVRVKKLSITNSRIKRVDVREPLVKGNSITIMNSTIDTLQRLHLSNETPLHIQDSILTTIGSKGLALHGGYGLIRNSSILHSADDGIILFAGTSFSLHDSGGNINIRAFTDINSTEISQQCPEIPTYYGGFVACLLLLILTLSLASLYIFYLRRLIGHIARQLEKPDNYELRKGSEHYVKQVTIKDINYKESPKEEKQPLVNDINIEQYQCVLEESDELNDMLLRSLQQEKTKYQENIDQIKSNLAAELEKLNAVSQEKSEQLENSKKFELQSLETQYKDEFSNTTLIYWERVKEILEKSKLFNEKLIEMKYNSLVYDVRVKGDYPTLQERVNIVKMNKDFITNVTNSIKNHLKQWPDIFTMIKGTNIDSDVAEKLFILLENLLGGHQTQTELTYDRLIKEQDNKYLSDFEEQQLELSKICSDLQRKTNEEKEIILADKNKALESKLPWSKKYIEEVDNLYSVREQLLETTINFEIKKVVDKYSEYQLKLLHLNAIIDIQESHKDDLEKISGMILNALDLSVKTLKLGIYDEKDVQNFNETRVGSNRSKQLFMDRYAQA